MEIKEEIIWNSRVSKEKIAKLYFLYSKSINDLDLLEDVAIGFYARCESIIAVTKIIKDKILCCPNCKKEIKLKNMMFSCKCGFSKDWKAVQATYKGKQLYGANAILAFDTFLKKYPFATNFEEKFIVVDNLINIAFLLLLFLNFFVKALIYAVLQKTSSPNKIKNAIAFTPLLPMEKMF